MPLLKVVDNGQFLESRVAFRYFWLNFRVVGMYPPQRYRLLYLIYALIATLNGIAMSFSILLNIYFISSAEEIINNLFLSACVFITFGKQLGMFYFRNTLRAVNPYLEKLDQRCRAHSEDRAHVFYGIRASHFIYKFYVCAYTISATLFVYDTISVGKPICEGWIPRIFEDPEKNITVLFIHQYTAFFSYTVVQNINNDSYPMCYIAMMIGHLRALAGRIQRIGKEQEKDLDANLLELVDLDSNLLELVECIKDYKNILNYYDCIRPVIATTIFMQFLITAIILVLSAINLMAFDHTMAQKLFILILTLGVILEIFPCCWFVDTLVLENSALTEAIYGCEWYNQNEKFRKMLVTFMLRTQRFKLILAGNLYPVKLDTFVTIMKFSFSVYTLLEKISIK